MTTYLKRFSASDSPIIPIFWFTAPIPKVKAFSWAQNMNEFLRSYPYVRLMGVGKICDFLLKSPFATETVRDGPVHWYYFLHPLTPSQFLDHTPHAKAPYPERAVWLIRFSVSLCMFSFILLLGISYTNMHIASSTRPRVQYECIQCISPRHIAL